MGVAVITGLLHDLTVSDLININIGDFSGTGTTVPPNTGCVVVGKGDHNINGDFGNYGLTLLTQSNGWVKTGMQSHSQVKGGTNKFAQKFLNEGPDANFVLNDANAMTRTSIKYDVGTFRNTGKMMLCGNGGSFYGDMDMKISAKELVNSGYMSLEQYNGPARAFITYEGDDEHANNGTIRLLNTRLKVDSKMTGDGCLQLLTGSNLQVDAPTEQSIYFWGGTGREASVTIGKNYYAGTSQPAPLTIYNFQPNCLLLFEESIKGKVQYDNGILTVPIQSSQGTVDVQIKIGDGYNSKGFQSGRGKKYQGVKASVWYKGTFPDSNDAPAICKLHAKTCEKLPTNYTQLKNYYLNFYNDASPEIRPDPDYVNLMNQKFAKYGI